MKIKKTKLEEKIMSNTECTQKNTAREIIELIENLTMFPAKINEQDADYICDLIAEKYDLEGESYD